MKIKLALAILLAIPSVAAAQETLAEQLRKAIVEEEVNQRLDKAIEAYTKILAQYEEDRKVSATALFHFAECCRKLGKQDQAIAAYERVAREFVDQKDLAAASRKHLFQTYHAKAVPASVGPEQVAQLRILADLITLVENQIKDAEKRVEIGVLKPSEVIPLKKELLELKLRLENVKQRILTPPVKK